MCYSSLVSGLGTWSVTVLLRMRRKDAHVEIGLMWKIYGLAGIKEAGWR